MKKREVIVKIIKSLRIHWYGHVMRKGKNPKITKWNPMSGRPRIRWKEQVLENNQELGIEDWKLKLKDRKQWRKIIHSVKTHHRL